MLVGVAVLGAVGCGGGHAQTRIVTATGYSFSGPSRWTVTRTPRSIQLAHGVELLAVTRFPLLHSYRPELWPKVVPEIDRSAAALAAAQKGRVSASATTTVAGEHARRYDIAYERNGKQLVERVGFVLHAKTEYELLCRFERGKSTSACDELFRSFKLT